MPGSLGHGRSKRVNEGRDDRIVRRRKGLPAHLTEPAYPCCLPALGGLSEVTPHGESGQRVRGDANPRSPTGNLPRGGFA